MKRRLIDIVSLDALRVFDCTARLMSFSAAARELSVTQAAVSRRIKHLEDMLGFTLYTRNGRQLTLTPKGERLFLRVQASLEYLGSELDELTATQTHTTLSISASAAISHLWLGERLQRFNEKFPEISVRLTTTDNLSELAQSGSELAIVFSKGTHPDWKLSPLLSEELIPVASPDFLQRSGIKDSPANLCASDLLRLALYDYGRSGVNSVTLLDWFEWAGVDPARLSPRIVFSDYILAIDAAVRGDGIILGSRALLQAHLNSGTLVELTNNVLVTGFGYYLGLPRHITTGQSAENLASFLVGTRSS